MSLASFLCSLVLSQKRSSTAANTPEPTSGIRLMTTGDAGGCFWGPNGIMALDYLPRPPRSSGPGRQAARQAEAILRLRQAILLIRAGVGRSV